MKYPIWTYPLLGFIKKIHCLLHKNDSSKFIILKSYYYKAIIACKKCMSNQNALLGKNYRVTKLSILYLVVSEIITLSLKPIWKF